MMDISFQSPITHLILITSEKEEEIRILAENCREMTESLSEIFYDAYADAIKRIYQVYLVVSESNPVRNTFLPEIESYMKEAGVNVSLSPIPVGDQFTSGKISLLLNSLWHSAGSVLLNDQPIATALMPQVFTLASRMSRGKIKLVLRKKGWFGTDDHFALIGSTFVVGPLLMGHQMRLPAHYGLAEMVQLMKLNCAKDEVMLIDSH